MNDISSLVCKTMKISHIYCFIKYNINVGYSKLISYCMIMLRNLSNYVTNSTTYYVVVTFIMEKKIKMDDKAFKTFYKKFVIKLGILQ